MVNEVFLRQINANRCMWFNLRQGSASARPLGIDPDLGLWRNDDGTPAFAPPAEFLHGGCVRDAAGRRVSTSQTAVGLAGAAYLGKAHWKSAQNEPTQSDGSADDLAIGAPRRRSAEQPVA